MIGLTYDLTLPVGLEDRAYDDPDEKEEEEDVGAIFSPASPIVDENVVIPAWLDAIPPPFCSAVKQDAGNSSFEDWPSSSPFLFSTTSSFLTNSLTPAPMPRIPASSCTGD